MSVLVTLNSPDNHIITKYYWNAEARINAHGVLQVIRYRRVIAEFPPSSGFLSWEYSLPGPPPQPTARAHLLLQHHEK